jgi:hypothetical protein
MACFWSLPEPQPRLRPVSSTPLGAPVVPEVYRMSAVSSGPARSPGAAYADYVRRTSGFIPWFPAPH